MTTPLTGPPDFTSTGSSSGESESGLSTVTIFSDFLTVTSTVTLDSDSVNDAPTSIPDPSESANSTSASLSRSGEVLLTTSYVSTVTTIITTNSSLTSAASVASTGNTTLLTGSTSSSTGDSTGASTATPTANPEPIASSSSGSSGLSTGAKAGIAVGAVAVVAIAGFLFWKFCFAKKRSSRRGESGLPPPFAQQRIGSSPSNSGGTSLEKSATPVVGALAAVNSRRSRNQPPAPENETLLPQQADDATVQSRFGTIYDQIELHAENFYKDSSPMIPPAIEGALSRYDTPLLGAPLAARLEESPRATTILKHVLSYEVSSTVVSPSPNDRKRSLLPSPLLAQLQETQSQQQPHQGGRRVGTTSSTYTRLKQLAASYRTSPHTMPSTSSATRDSAAHFSRVFSLWADPQYDEARRTQHLAEVLDQAVKFSVWLLSQPETFELRWDGSAAAVDKETAGVGAGDHSLITVPALVKVSSNGGQRLSPGEEKVLSRAVYRRI